MDTEEKRFIEEMRIALDKAERNYNDSEIKECLKNVSTLHMLSERLMTHLAIDLRG